MTAEEWLEAFARQTGLVAPSAEDMDEILRLASVAAHASERKAAPIACWIAGTSGRPIGELTKKAEEISRNT